MLSREEIKGESIYSLVELSVLIPEGKESLGDLGVIKEV